MRCASIQSQSLLINDKTTCDPGDYVALTIDDYRALSKQDSIVSFDQIGVTSSSVMKATSFGFGLVFMFALTGYLIGIAIKLIRSI